MPLFSLEMALNMHKKGLAIQKPYLYLQSTANSNSFKIVQKTAFEAKGRLYTTGKVIRRLFIIDLHTQLAIDGYR